MKRYLYNIVILIILLHFYACSKNEKHPLDGDVKQILDTNFFTQTNGKEKLFVFKRTVDRFNKIDQEERIKESLMNKYGNIEWSLSLALTVKNGGSIIVTPFVKNDSITAIIFSYNSDPNKTVYKIYNQLNYKSYFKYQNDSSKLDRAAVEKLFKSFKINHFLKKKFDNSTIPRATYISTYCWRYYGYGGGTDDTPTVWVTTWNCTTTIIIDNSGDNNNQTPKDNIDPEPSGGYPQEYVYEEKLVEITKDTSISNNARVDCIYRALMNAGLENGLAKVLAEFQGETGYNVSFVIGDIPNQGQTVQTSPSSYTSKNMTITIRRSDALDVNYSRIFLAKTFIHEAFHAKLIQYAIKNFGTIEMSSWPKNINNATLNELMDYVEDAAKIKGMWSSNNAEWGMATHDWMVQNIDQMALTLKEFVSTYYPTNANEVLNTQNPLEPYRALMFMGLQGSQFYNEKVNSTRAEIFKNYQQDLASGTKNCP